jgi:ABC-2 type transport system ATP-binding protein
VIAEGTPGQLKASVGSGSLHVRVLDPVRRAEARRLLERVLGVPVAEAGDPAALTARVPDGAPTARALTALEDAGLPLAQFALGQPSLDEVFLALTGRPADSTPPDPEDPR